LNSRPKESEIEELQKNQTKYGLILELNREIKDLLAKQKEVEIQLAETKETNRILSGKMDALLLQLEAYQKEKVSFISSSNQKVRAPSGTPPTGEVTIIFTDVHGSNSLDFLSDISSQDQQVSGKKIQRQ
jgi:seryl-tRNA synthetase